MSLKRKFLLSIGYLFFFLLFYLEPLYIGPIKIALIWKAGILLLIAMLAILERKILWHPIIYISLIFSLFQFFSTQGLNNLVVTISHATPMLTVPLLSIGGYYFINNNYHLKIKKYLHHFLVFVSLSSIPFHLNLLNPLGKVKQLSSFDTDVNMFTGIFQTPHSASFIFGVAFIIGIWLTLISKPKKNYLYVILIFIVSYSLIVTYVRVGMLIAAVGFIGIFWKNRKNRILLSSGIVGSLLLFVFLGSNELFISRLLDQRAFGQSDIFSSLGSGRLLIWFNSISIFFTSSPIEQIFGLGPAEFSDRMFSAIGSKIYSHNGFLDVLNINGILGLLIYLFYLFFLWRASNNISHPHYQLFAKCIFMSLVVWFFVQGDKNFLFESLISCIVLLNTFEKNANKNLKI